MATTTMGSIDRPSHGADCAATAQYGGGLTCRQGRRQSRIASGFDRPRRPGRRRRRPTQAWPQLLGHDLDQLPAAAILSGPAPLLEPAHDHDPAALGQRLADMLGLVTPHHHSEERRYLLPATRDGHPEHRSGDPTVGLADLGVLGEVAGEADVGLGHGPAPS
jgi:hypothetical protein